MAYNEENVGRVISRMSAIAIATYLLINSHLQPNLVLGFSVRIRLAIVTVDKQSLIICMGWPVVWSIFQVAKAVRKPYDPP